MRRWLAVAALGAALLTLPAWGQRRGGASRGFAGHAGFASRGSIGGGRGPLMVNRTRSFGNVQRGGVRFDNGFGRRSSLFFHHHHHQFFRSWPYAAYYGYAYGYPWDYGDNSYAADSYQNYPSSDYPNAYVDNSREQEQIDRLENEVDRLRAEREARESHASQARSKADSEPTELVFRDKHTEEVQNY